MHSQIEIDCENLFAGQPATPSGLVSKEVGSVVSVTAVLIVRTLRRLNVNTVMFRISTGCFQAIK